MKDRDFLIWIHQRLIHRHDEPHNIDYMGKLRSIIMAMSPDTDTANTSPELRKPEEFYPDA